MSKEVLESVFGRFHEGAGNAAQLAVTPSSVSRELAQQAIESIELSVIFRDIGFIVAREIANTLEAMSLRAADYVDLPDMPQMIAAMVAGELASAPPEFVQALIEQMKLRG